MNDNPPTQIEIAAANLMTFFQKNICPFETSADWPVDIRVDEDYCPELCQLMQTLEDQLVARGLMKKFEMPRR